MATGGSDRFTNKGQVTGLEQVLGKSKRVSRGEAFDENRATVISDSICQLIYNLLHTRVQSVHGGTMENLEAYCRGGVVDIAKFSAILVHFGTNDLTDRCPPDQCARRIVASLDRAISFIRGINPNARIGVSGILPRPRDQNNSNMLEVRIVTNVQLRTYCLANNLEYFKSETMLKKRDPTINPFAHDNLHLSEAGAGYFKAYLEGKVGVLMGLPPQI
jgi:hypothetical protein